MVYKSLSDMGELGKSECPFAKVADVIYEFILGACDLHPDATDFKVAFVPPVSHLLVACQVFEMLYIVACGPPI